MTAPSPLFAALDLAEATAKAAAEKKLLLVDATAEWCGPCKHMDRTTWVDPKVVETLSANAIVIQLDVDAKADDAARLKIKSMPTVVAFSSEGDEIDRVVGFQTPDDLIAWASGLARGETSLQRLQREAAAAPKDIKLRVSVARHHAQRGDLAAATPEYVWVWKHMLEHDPQMIGLRHTLFAAELEAHVAAHPPSRTAFAALRDETTPLLEGLDANTLADWFSLNQMLGEQAASLAFYDAHSTSILARPDVRERIIIHIIPMLEAADRFADIARFFDDPLGELRKAGNDRDAILKHVLKEDTPEVMALEMKKMVNVPLEKTASLLSRALRAANRVDEATALEDEARRLGVPVAEPSA